jgi:hypothetical protein
LQVTPSPPLISVSSFLCLHAERALCTFMQASKIIS